MGVKKHNYVRRWGINRNTVSVNGRFQPNGSSAVDSTKNLGMGWTVARTSAGLFTVTFDENYQDLISGFAHLQQSAADDKFAQLTQWTKSARTLTITIWDISAAAATDVANGAHNWIHFGCEFATGKVRPIHS